MQDPVQELTVMVVELQQYIDVDVTVSSPVQVSRYLTAYV
jgi:hypothetical protein